MQITKDKR